MVSSTPTGSVPVSVVKWREAHRLIPSRFPPIDLFDDIAPPEDWELLAAAEAKTNPRIYDEIGNLGLVPAERRVSSSWVMGAFTHVSTDRPSRFTDGGYGIYYCARELETALRETAFHQGRFFASTRQAEGWLVQMRQLICAVDNSFHDLRTGNHIALLDRDDYRAAQKFGKALKDEGSNGIVYPSPRHEGGECLAAFWPNVIGIPVQASHWLYHWNGETIDYVKKLNDTGARQSVFKLF